MDDLQSIPRPTSVVHDSATEDQRSSIASDSTIAGSSSGRARKNASFRSPNDEVGGIQDGRFCGISRGLLDGEEGGATTPAFPIDPHHHHHHHRRPSLSSSHPERASLQSSKFSGADSLGLGNAGLVDLHPNMTKPITDSVFLMSSYVNHLSQLNCDDWVTPAPEPSYNPDASNVESRCGFHVHRSTGSMYLTDHLPVFTYVKQVRIIRAITESSTLARPSSFKDI